MEEQFTVQVLTVKTPLLKKTMLHNVEEQYT